jgi:hypothetical protein
MATRRLPLSDAPELWTYASRTRQLRIALAVAVLAVFGALVATAFSLQTRATSYFAKGGNGIVVLDLSASVDPRANARLATFMRTLADSDQRIGLVAFEEQAYELLPPGTRGDEIRPMLRFFGTSNPLSGPTTPGHAPSSAERASGPASTSHGRSSSGGARVPCCSSATSRTRARTTRC